MNKRYFRRLRFCILFLCVSFGFMAKCQTVKADLMLDGRQIDGSYAIFFDQQPLREIQYNGVVVWRAGADITYIIDSNISETHFVPYGQTTLAVTGSKEGYEFAGWRTDTTASGDVLETDLCTGDEKTLYAVFRRVVTVSYYNGSDTKQTAVDYVYYNNGNISNPEFTIAQEALDGWTCRGWATDEAADAEIIYDELDHTALTSDVTLYGIYENTITLTTVVQGNKSSKSGSVYYNSSGNMVNPTFTISNPAISGATFNGWSKSSDSASISYSTINNLSLSDTLVLYAVIKYDNVIASTHGTYYAGAAGDKFNTIPNTFVSGIDCSKYQGISVACDIYAQANGGSGELDLLLKAGNTIQTIAHSFCDYTGEDCTDVRNSNLNVTIYFSQTSGSTDLVGYGEVRVYAQGVSGFIRIVDNKVTLIGKTVVG